MAAAAGLSLICVTFVLLMCYSGGLVFKLPVLTDEQANKDFPQALVCNTKTTEHAADPTVLIPLPAINTLCLCYNCVTCVLLFVSFR